MLYSRRGALTSSSVNSPCVFTTVVPRAAPRDQHAALNYASKPKLGLEPAELNVWPFATDRLRPIGVNELHFFIDRPRDGAFRCESHHHFRRPAARLWLLSGAQT